MPEIDIGIDNFLNLNPRLNIWTKLKMPLDKMRVVYPLQENDEQPATNVPSLESVQPSTSTSIDSPMINASSTELETSKALSSSSAENSINETIQTTEQDMLIEYMPLEHANESSTSQTAELPEQYEFIIVQQIESTSNQNKSELPQRKKPRDSINPEKKPKSNNNELKLPQQKKLKKKHKCTYPNCDKSYNRSDHLREHVNTKHLDKKWRCHNCHDYLYTTKKGKENHIKKNPDHSVYEAQD